MRIGQGGVAVRWGIVGYEESEAQVERDDCLSVQCRGVELAGSYYRLLSRSGGSELVVRSSARADSEEQANNLEDVVGTQNDGIRIRCRVRVEKYQYFYLKTT